MTVVALLQLNTLVWAVDATTTTKPRITLAVFDNSLLTSNRVQRVCDHMVKNIPVAVRVVRPSQQWLKLRPVDLEQQVSGLLTSPDFGIIALLPERLDGVEDLTPYGKSKVGLVFVGPLWPETNVEMGRDELFVRRLEKETMRWAGLLLGLGPCKWPRCVLFQMSGVDARGRNFCPPCAVRAERLLELKSGHAAHNPEVKELRHDQ